MNNNNTTIQPLKTLWKVDEDAGFVPEQIRERVRSEDNYTWAKGYQLTEFKNKVDMFFPRTNY